MFEFKGAFAKDPSLRRLTIVAVGIGSFGLLGMYYVQHKTIKTVQNEPFYKRTLDIFYGYEYGVNLLGTPVKPFANRQFMDRRMNFMYAEGKKAKLTIPMEGHLKNGMVHSYSSKTGGKWMVDKADMQVDGTMWTFYLHPDKISEYQLTENMSIEDYENQIGVEKCYPMGVQIKGADSEQTETKDTNSKEPEIKDSDSKQITSKSDSKGNSDTEKAMKYL